jgi:hypothetical protein
MGRRDSIPNTQTTIGRTYHLKKHRMKAEDKSIHIQHTNKHKHDTIEDKQKKNLDRKN